MTKYKYFVFLISSLSWKYIFFLATKFLKKYINYFKYFLIIKGWLNLSLKGGKVEKLIEENEILIEDIRKYNFWYFENLIDTNYFRIIEQGEIIYPNEYKSDFEKITFLRLLKSNLIEIETIIKNIDFEIFSYVVGNIFKNNGNINEINKTLNLHFDISVIFFKYISIIERNIKNKIIWYLKKNNSFFFNLIESLIKEDIKENNKKRFEDLLKYADDVINKDSFPNEVDYNPSNVVGSLEEDDNNESNEISYKNKKDSVMLNEFSISDLIKFFESIKDNKFKKYFAIVDFLKELFGDKKYKEIYNRDSKINIVPWFIEELKTLSKIRNKVMHNKNLFDGNDKYKIKDGIFSIINLSFQENNIGNNLYADLSLKVYSYLKEINKEGVYKYFDREILNIKLWN